MHAYIHTYMYIYIFNIGYIHTCIHTYIHIYIYTPWSSSSSNIRRSAKIRDNISKRRCGSHHKISEHVCVENKTSVNVSVYNKRERIHKTGSVNICMCREHSSTKRSCAQNTVSINIGVVYNTRSANTCVSRTQYH